MDNVRLFLYSAVAILALLLWNQWQQEHARPPQAEVPEIVEGQPTGAPPAAGEANAPASGQPAPGQPRREPQAAGQPVRVVTDLLDVTISTRGGDIRGAKLRKYSVAADDPTPFQLLNDQGQPLFVAESGLHADEGAAAPGPNAVYQAPAREFRLAEGDEELVVPLVWVSDSGLRVTKTYTFHRDSYAITQQYQVENVGEQPWRAYPYSQLRRTPDPDEGGSFLFGGNRSYTGGVIYNGEDKYRKVSFEDMREEPLSRETKNGWAAMMQHYFLAAWVPQPELAHRYYTQARNGEYVIGVTSPWMSVPAGQTVNFPQQVLYVGPKEQDRLAAIASGLELTVDYGLLTVISKPLYWLLDKIHGLIGNWGWAIVLLTLLIKIVFYKLSETSYRSMARMRKMQPKMQALKERHGDDRQALNQAMMELYKKEKINPLGGCLPIVIQIPVFIALYWVLLESVELRQADFILWINDLAAPDPYFVLPILMGVSMLVQQRLNPAPMDPIQQKVMMFLPVVFTVFFLFFPAGLVLYWVTNNTLSIAQQALITRRIERGEDKPKPKKK